MENVNLVDDIFSKHYHFESSILCSYGLNLNFFENYLMKLDALCSSENICIFTDSGTYDSFIREAYIPRWLNKKYLVNRLSTIGVFHPKLYMFASENVAMIGIGSANLTREGIASNLELLSTFTISEKDTSYSALLCDCIEYVRRLASISKSKTAIDQIDVFYELTGKYRHSDIASDVRFIHNLDSPIIESIKQFTLGQRISKIQILSPFFDSELQPLKSLLKTFPDCKYEIYFQQNKSNFPKGLFNEIKRLTKLMLYINIERYLHGKAILFHSDDTIILYMGSANFTKSALLERASDGNYEIGLIGQIDKEKSENILCPNKTKAKIIRDVAEIEVSATSSYDPGSGFIDFIIEAVLKGNHVNIEINHDISDQVFIPKKIRILDFYEKRYEVKIGKDFTIELNPSIRKILNGKMAVQIIGTNPQREDLESNIAWVIEIEEKEGGSLHRKLRKIYNDPFELISVLQEILKTGGEEELRRFLLTFDIPLDLVLPPRKYKGPGITITKGNIEGTLPTHSQHIFNAKILDAYNDCLSRLYSKLQRHAENPQVNKINNVIMIISSLYSLIWFINNEVIYRRHKDLRVITPDNWSLIRDYYDMLLKFISDSWGVLWSKGGYRHAINLRMIKNEPNHTDNNINTFNDYLLDVYGTTIEELISIGLKTIESFELLRDKLLIKTVFGEEIKPFVFPNNHHNIQPAKVLMIKDAINSIIKK